MTSATDIVLILVTAPAGDETEALARTLVEERLAACVNVHAPMTSFYRWRGAIERDAERQLIIKTTRRRIAEIEARIATLHPYDLPEFLVVEVTGGSQAYLAWVAENAAPEGGR